LILKRDAQPESAIRAADRVGIQAGTEAVVLATVGANGQAFGSPGLHSCSATYEVVAARAVEPRLTDWMKLLWSIGRTKPKITYGGVPVPNELPSISLIRMAALFRRESDGDLWVSPPFSLAYFEVPEVTADYFNRAGGTHKIVRGLAIGDVAQTFERIGIQSRPSELWMDDPAVQASGFNFATLKGYTEMAIGSR
jgi:hypothetical protein